MADQVAELCRQYVADNAETYRGHEEDDAVDALVQGFLRHLADQGWDAAEADYHIDIRDGVRAGLKQYRGRR